MKIWLINNYNMLPEHGQLNRNYYLGKYLKKLGNEPVAFVGSHPHNTNLQLINGTEKYRVYQDEPFPWVLIKTRNYEGSTRQRAFSMIEFYFNMKKTAKFFARPDAVVGSSAHPFAALIAIKLGKKYGCKSIMEIRDLWPESIVSYGILPKNSLLVRLLYRFEKYLYKHADELIFTMENAGAYLTERGLDTVIPSTKIHYLNNGVDLEEFQNNLKEYPIMDEDLSNPQLFKVVYTGSIRRVNNLGLLLDAAKKINNKQVRLLIWGAGEEVKELEHRCQNENITNVVFKGIVEKKYVASITSQANLNILHGSQSPIFKYGLSANKLFDYAAAGKAILTDFPSKMNPADLFGAGITVSEPTPENIAAAIDGFASMSPKKYRVYCENALEMAKAYSFENLAKKMIQIIEGKDQ